MLIVERIQYTAYISAALQSVKVLDREDDEELNNHFLHRTSKMRTSILNQIFYVLVVCVTQSSQNI